MQAAHFAEWLESYNRSAVCAEPPPPDSLRRLCAGRAHCLSSHLPRASTSARLVCGDARIAIDPLFREAELSTAILPPFRCTPIVHWLFSRALWLLGHAGGVEPFRAARRRARECAIALETAGSEGTPVVLFGHGFMNRLIGAQLKRRGWRREGRSARGYWSCATYRRDSGGTHHERRHDA